MDKGSVCIKIGLTGNIPRQVFILQWFTEHEYRNLTLGDDTKNLDKIKTAALTLYCKVVPEASNLSLEDVNLDLEFRDEENDVIIVESDSDLCGYFTILSKKKGKVYANVKPLKVASNVTSNAPSQSVTTQTEADHEEKKCIGQNEDQKIINAIADIFSIAAVSMKAGITAAMMEDNLADAKSTTDAMKAAKATTNKVSLDSLKVAKKLTKESYKMIHRAMKHHTGDTTSMKETKNVVLNEKELIGDVGHLGKDNHDTTTPTFDLPPVHKRHTCDQCRQNPIVGTRYHATNLPDFDLCERCHDVFQRTGIVFNEIGMANSIPSEFVMKVDSTDTTSSNEKQADANVKSDPPLLSYIHKRHTCDKCFSNPIIGKRYRAANLPDFDLCEVCYHDKFEIVFEKAQPQKPDPIVFSVSTPIPNSVSIDATEDNVTRIMDPVIIDKNAGKDVHQKNIGVNDPTEIPFIHGRHTCDQCLTTPIVGKRFHATNIPDYDLCETCHGNYKGADVVFEEAQLERDAPFQERWNRKRALHEGRLKHKMAHRHRFQSRCQRRSHCYSDRSPAPAEGKPEEASNVVNVDISVEPPSAPVCTKSDDLALEEAIRRSLVDIAVSNDATEKESIGTSPVLMNGDDDNLLAVTSPSYTEIRVEPEIVVPPSSPETSSSSAKDASFVASDDVESEVVVHLTSSPTVSTSEKESSFAMEALGSGEVAEFVGETLDRMSEAIEDLNKDLMDGDDVVIGRDDEASEDGYDFSGPKIVDGEDDDVSAGSWSVVEEKEEHSIGDDSGLGRAAEAIGSVLFQSDMMRSIDGASAAMSSVTSVPTEAPSITTHDESIPTIQLQRWATQLEQLHELGFQNDAECIDALESLSAANIGVDSDEEVTVQQVIEKLMDN